MLPLLYGCSEYPITKQTQTQVRFEDADFGTSFDRELDLGTVFTSNYEQNLKVASFEFQNLENNRVLVKIGGTSWSCAGATVNGAQQSWLGPGVVCNIAVSVELPAVRRKDFYQFANIYVTNPTTEEVIRYSCNVRANVFPLLNCTNLPENGVFNLDKSGFTSIRLVSYDRDKVPCNSFIDCDESQLDVTIQEVSTGIEDGAHYRLFDLLVRRKSISPSAIREKVHVIHNGGGVSFEIQDVVTHVVADKRSVFFRRSGESHTKINLQLIAKQPVHRIEFDKELINVELINQGNDQSRLLLWRKVDRSFEAFVSLWLADNDSAKPDLVIPVFCL